MLAKYILLVEPAPGRLSRLAPALKELRFEVLLATSVRAAAELVGRTPLLSLVAIDDAIGVEEGASLVARLKQDNPDLPVMWVTSRRGAAPLSLTEYTPDALLHHPLDPNELERDVQRLLLGHLYPPEVVEMVAGAAREVMAEAYDTSLTLVDANIRANRNALGAINAILPFCGRAIAGRLAVAAELEMLLEIRSRLFPGERGDVADAEDLAGEYANLIAGRVKAHFAGRDLLFELGTPILLAGTEVRVRYRASRPALVLTLEGSGGRLRVAFCFDTVDPQRLAGGAHGHEVVAGSSGELCFL